jgi:uncharacterized protein YndB with AHSA1/START domain
MESDPIRMQNRTTVERKSDCKLVVTRTFDGTAHIVFEAWTKPEIFKQWWVPKSPKSRGRMAAQSAPNGAVTRSFFDFLGGY